MNFSLDHTMQTFTGKMKPAFLPFAASFGAAWLQGLFTGNFSSSRQKDQTFILETEKNSLGCKSNSFFTLISFILYFEKKYNSI